jgi:hypothetical protein
MSYYANVRHDEIKKAEGKANRLFAGAAKVLMLVVSLLAAGLIVYLDSRSARSRGSDK